MTLELRDLQLTCNDCGSEFSFTIEQQSSFAEKGWAHPIRCADCRHKKKLKGQTLAVPPLTVSGVPMTGTVKRFDTNTGWGFIDCDNGEEAFVRYSQIISPPPPPGQEKEWRTLVEGQRVKFLLVAGKDNKPKAANVRVVEG